jgi:hypothetical protein
MTPHDFAGLAPKTRRRLMLWALFRAVLTVTLLVVLYYVLPMDHAFDSATIALLVVGLLVFTVLVAWQVRSSASCRPASNVAPPRGRLAPRSPRPRQPPNQGTNRRKNGSNEHSALGVAPGRTVGFCEMSLCLILSPSRRSNRTELGWDM